MTTPVEIAPLGTQPEQLFISIVVPIRNEARYIGHTIDSLLAQDYEQFEIIVVDGQSDDETAAIVNDYCVKHGQVHLLENPRRWSSAARNIGSRKARGDVILMVDGHCEIPDNGLLRRLADAFTRSGVDVVGRPQPLHVQGANSVQEAIALVRSSPLGHHPDSFIYAEGECIAPAESIGVAYRRGVFDTVGWFDELFDACEDVDFNLRCDRAGMRCLFTSAAAVHYYPRDTLTGLFRQLVRYGRGRVRLARKHQSWSLKFLLPGMLVLGIITGPAFALIAPPLAWLYIGVLAIWVGTIVVASIAVCARAKRWRRLPHVVAAFLVVHLGAGWGVLRELVLPARRTAREVA